MWRVVPATFGDRRVFDQLQGLVEAWRATWGDFRWHGRGGSEIFRSYSQCLTPGEAKSLYQLKHLRGRLDPSAEAKDRFGDHGGSAIARSATDRMLEWS